MLARFSPHKSPHKPPHTPPLPPLHSPHHCYYSLPRALPRTCPALLALLPGRKTRRCCRLRLWLGERPVGRSRMDSAAQGSRKRKRRKGLGVGSCCRKVARRRRKVCVRRLSRLVDFGQHECSTQNRVRSGLWALRCSAELRPWSLKAFNDSRPHRVMTLESSNVTILLAHSSEAGT